MSRIRANQFTDKAGTGAPTFPNGVQVTGVSTLGNTVVGGATTQLIVTGNARVTGILTIGSSSVTIDGSNNQVNVGSGVTIHHTNGVQVGSNTLHSTGLTVSGVSTFIGISTFNDIDIKGATETVAVAATYSNGSLSNIVLECDHDLGTVFTHNIGNNGTVGIVSIKNFPATKNSATTYTIIFTQQSTTPSGTGNTTALTGIGTNIFLRPTNVTGFSTSARIGSASTVTLSSTANDIDIVSFMIHYNGGGTGTVSNYNVYVSNNGSFRYGTVKP